MVDFRMFIYRSPMKRLAAPLVMAFGLGAASPTMAQLPLAPSAGLGGLVSRPFSIKLTRSSLGIENLRVPNPRGFRGGELARVSRATVRFDLKHLVSWPVRFKEVSVELDQLTLVKNESGRMNIDAFKLFPLPGLLIDKLDVKIGKVILVDRSAGRAPHATEMKLNFHETYERVTEFSHLVSRVWQKIIRHMQRATVLRVSFSPLRAASSAASQVAKLFF